MRQTVKVVGEYSRGYIEVEYKRVTACGRGCGGYGSSAACESGGGCSFGASPEVIRVKARGGEGTKPGDSVIIESSSRLILGLAALVYLLPLALFFAGYAISPLSGGLGFVLGLLLLIPVNKIVSKRTFLFKVVT